VGEWSISAISIYLEIAGEFVACDWRWIQTQTDTGLPRCLKNALSPSDRTGTWFSNDARGTLQIDTRRIEPGVEQKRAIKGDWRVLAGLASARSAGLACCGAEGALEEEAATVVGAALAGLAEDGFSATAAVD
jgi:hypothetical protein